MYLKTTADGVVIVTNEESEKDQIAFSECDTDTHAISTDTLLSIRYLPPEISEYRIDWAGKTYYIKSGQLVEFYVDHIKVDGERIE